MFEEVIYVIEVDILCFIFFVGLLVILNYVVLLGFDVVVEVRVFIIYFIFNYRCYGD